MLTISVKITSSNYIVLARGINLHVSSQTKSCSLAYIVFQFRRSSMCDVWYMDSLYGSIIQIHAVKFNYTKRLIGITAQYWHNISIKNDNFQDHKEMSYEQWTENTQKKIRQAVTPTKIRVTRFRWVVATHQFYDSAVVMLMHLSWQQQTFDDRCDDIGRKTVTAVRL